MSNNIIGTQIQKLRNSRDFTQDELAEKIGVSKQTISNWETGLKNPRMGAIQKLADLFNVSKSYIIDGRDSPQETPSLYKISNFISEVQEATENFTVEEKERVLSFIYDIKSDKQRVTSEEMSILDLAQSLSSTNIQAIDNLSSYIVRVINNGDQVLEDGEMLLKDCKIAVDQNRTSTIEFVNTKRKIYEFLLPLAALANAYDQGIVTIKDLSEAFKLTREFILEVIIYHANTKGSIVEYDGYIFDFSSIPIEFSNIDELDSIEINVKDTNEKRNKLHNKKMAKKKTR